VTAQQVNDADDCFGMTALYVDRLTWGFLLITHIHHQLWNFSPKCGIQMSMRHVIHSSVVCF